MSRKVFSSMVNFKFDGLYLVNGIKNRRKENIYIWPVKLNGKLYSKAYIIQRQ
jgi:hypothetical protein